MARHTATVTRRRQGRPRLRLRCGVAFVILLGLFGSSGCTQSDALGGAAGSIWRPADVQEDRGAAPDSDVQPDGEAPDIDAPPAPRTTGEPCRSAGACQGERCLEQGFAAGYCTRQGCDDGRGCSGGDAACARVSGFGSICVDGCTRDANCREGYRCQSTETDGIWGCLPDGMGRDPDFAATRQVLDLRCDPQIVSREDDFTTYAFDFQIDQGVDGFLAVPLAFSGQIRPVTLKTPGESIDLVEGYRHHNSPALYTVEPPELTGFGTFGKVGMTWPIQVPYAPKYQKYVHPGGSYTLRVRADAPQPPCFYLLQNRGTPTLDLNIYVIGSDPMSDETAATNPDLAEAIGQAETLLARGSVELGDVRFPRVSEAVVQEFSRVTSRLGAYRLTAYGRPPNDTREGHLSVDVFMVEDLALDGAGAASVLGLSAGLPGAAGLHGNARNGIIMQTTDLGFDNEHVGHILAHELGHYLGLRHTTEASHDTVDAPGVERVLGTTDPIEDTAVCDDIAEKINRRPSECGDFDNLMFPMAPPPGSDIQPRLTDGQATVLGRNPLVKE